MKTWLKQRKFRDLVRRQLGLFAADNADLVERARKALVEYHAEPDAEFALEQYSEHDDLSEDVEAALFDMCERYAQTLAEGLEPAYVAEFNRQAKAQYRDLIPRLNIYTGDED